MGRVSSLIRAWSIALLAGLACAAPAGDPIGRLGEVRSIFVVALGTGPGPAALRDKIVREVASLPGIKVVDDPAQADAILDGIAEVSIDYSAVRGPTPTADDWERLSYPDGVAVRLVSMSGGMLWYHEVTPAALGSWNFSSNLAGRIRGALWKAIEKSRAARRGLAKTPGDGGCPAAPGGASRLGTIRRIFLEPADTFDDSAQVRMKVIGRLFRSREFTIVGCASDADALLSVYGGVQTIRTPVPNPEGPDTAFTDYRARANIRLVGGAARVLLGLEIEREHYHKWTATSKAAAQAAGQIIRAVRNDRRR